MYQRKYCRAHFYKAKNVKKCRVLLTNQNRVFKEKQHKRVINLLDRIVQPFAY